MTPRRAVELAALMQHAVLVDALREGSAAYWRHRAQTFRDARPRQDEHTGG